MSKLNRMKISGIRSFGPEDNDEQHIKFQSPLTLIQGQNGCGKTTIIEALKFAITGELPGGSKSGQGFVYDPKLAKAFECRGQVMLRVTDTKGEIVTVSKKVCVNQKLSKLEFKRLDSTIARGKETHISGKCADIDNEMCLVLGVSKPVLNSVIFCHQEESNWPLDENKKVKERFDDIFDATKYSKCLENMIKYKKKNVENQKILKIQLANMEDKKLYVEKKRQELQQKQEKLDSISEKIQMVKQEFQPINNRLEEINGIERNFNKLYTDAEFKKKELKHLNQQQQEILSNITEFIGSDEELKGKLTSFETDLKSINNDIKALETKRQEVERSENKLRNNINEQERKLGALHGEEEQNKEREESRKKLIQQSLKDFDFKNVSPELIQSEEDIQAVIRDLNGKLQDYNNEVLKLEKELEEEEKLLQNEIDKLREESAQLKQNIDSKNKQLKEFIDEDRQVQQKLQELNTADDQLKFVEGKLNRVDRELNALESSVDVESLRTNIESEKQKVNQLEERLSVVDNEIQTLQHYSSLQTELDLYNETAINKQDELQKLKNKHEQVFKHIFPDGIPSFELKSATERYQKKQTQQVRDINNKINEKQTVVTKLETNLSVQREKLKERENELENNRSEISKHCKDKSLDEVSNEINVANDKMRKERGVYYSSQYLYQKFIQQFQATDPCCPLCKRRVEEQKMVDTIIGDLKKKIENFPNELKKIEEQLKESETKYQKLLGLKPLNEKIHKLSEDVPKLENDVINLELSLATATEELKELRNSLSVSQKNQDLASSVISDAALIDQNQKELIRIKKEIAILTSKIPHNESTRSIQEALAEQDTLKIDTRSARNNMESWRNKLQQHSDRLQKQRELRNELIAQQLNIQKNLQDKDHLIAKQTELETKLMVLKSELEELKIQVEPLKTKLMSAIKIKEEQKVINRRKLDKSRNNLNARQKQVENIVILQSAIDDFNGKNIPTQIESVNISVTKFKSELNNSSEKKLRINKNIEDLKSQVTNNKVYFRELQDNIQLREKRKQSELLKKEIDQLEEKLGNDDIQTIKREKDNLEDKLTQMRELKHKAQGKRGELKESIEDINKELALPANEKATLNYKKKFLELKLHEQCTADLQVFMKAMDWAMMQFHKQKMVQINTIIRDLWRSIYKGNDCDYIEMKTEEDTVGSDRRKVYNYRVVQVKNEIELDMRGRCSAGQKVLACLIIRIALADTFSSNCGILALDEPTTNLDRQNIQSLSEALVDLVGQKKRQKNFQLLVITHDQEFVDKLTSVENLDSYYVIKRNEQGKSVITIQNIR